MADSIPYTRIKSDVLSIARSIPSGRVATDSQIGSHLRVTSRLVAHVISLLDDAERATVPWWRIVADGGAIGRHSRRDEQFERLRSEGIVLSPVGIVQDIDIRRVDNIAAVLAGRVPAMTAASVEPTGKPARSRGMRGVPIPSIRG